MIFPTKFPLIGLLLYSDDICVYKYACMSVISHTCENYKFHIELKSFSLQYLISNKKLLLSAFCMINFKLLIFGVKGALKN